MDITQVQQTGSGSTSPYEGVSTPPDNGAVTSVDTPPDQMQPNGGPGPSQTSPSPQPNQPQGPPQPAQAQGQPQGPSGSMKGPTGPQTPSSGTPDVSQHPSVARAGIVHEIAQALVGPRGYSYSVNPNTGEMVKTARPLSKGDIGLAIALEALSGAITGAPQSGPNATAKATQAAMAQAQGQQQQLDQQKREQATQDYARRAQILQTNMNMRVNAMSVARQDLEQNEKLTNQYQAYNDMMVHDHPDLVEGEVRESDLGKYNVTSHMGTPYHIVPRLDADGHQVKDPLGVPQYELTYLIMKPEAAGAKISGGLTAHEQEIARKSGLPGFGSDLIGEVPMKNNLILSQKAQISTIEAAEHSLDTFFQSLNDVGSRTQYSYQPVSLSNQEYDKMADDAAARYNISPHLLKALILQEDPKLDPSAVNPKSGATGLGQLMPATAQQLGVTDRADPRQNIDGAAHYLALQLQRTNGNLPLALASYNAGPNNVVNGKIPQNGETPQYVDSIMKRVGAAEQQSSSTSVTPPDFYAAISKDPGLRQTVTRYQAALVHSSGSDGQISYAQALKSLDPADQARMLNYLAQGSEGKDGLKNANTVDLNNHLRILDANQEQAAKVAEEKARVITQQKQDAALRFSTMIDNRIKGPQGFQFDPNMKYMGSDQLERTLKAQGVDVPADFPTLYGIGHYALDPKDYVPKVWRTGDPEVMSQSQALSFIRRFVNPDFDQKDYGNMSKTEQRLANPDSNFNKSILQVGTATNHMELLRQMAHEVSQGRPLGGQYPALNQLAGELGVQLGKDDFSNLQALTRAVNVEMSNVAGGGFAPHREAVEQTLKNMTAANSEQQIDGLIRVYTGLMHGRLSQQQAWLKSQYDGNDPELKGKGYIRGIDPHVDQLFKRYGLSVPWEHQPNNTQPTQNQPRQAGQTATGNGQVYQLNDPMSQLGKQLWTGAPMKPNDTSQYKQISTSGNIGIGQDGKKYYVATGQPVTQ